MINKINKICLLLLASVTIKSADMPQDGTDVAEVLGHVIDNVVELEEQKDICAICQEGFEDGQLTMRGVCGEPLYNHILHRDCADLWFSAHQDSCPACRGSFIISCVRPPEEAPVISIFHAVRRNYLGILEEVIASGVDINVQDDEGQTPLMLACRFGHFDSVKLLLDSDDIILEIEDNGGKTAIMLSQERGDLEIVKALEAKKMVQTYRPELWQKMFCKATKDGNLRILELAIASGVDLNYRNVEEGGETALIHAIQLCDKRMTGFLLSQAGINVNIQDNEGFTALMLACEKGDLKLIESLLGKADVDVNIQNLSGQTALMMACASKRVECIELLLRKSEIYINTKDSLGNTALMYSFDSWFDASEPLLKRLDIRLDLINEENKDVLDLAYDRRCYALARKIEIKRFQKYNK